jgi:AraC family transcriptional regulator
MLLETRRVLDYIDQNLEQEFTVSDLARIAHLSVFHFARVFASTMGMPPQRYVSQRRLESAKKMIGTGRLPLSEIAFRSGFSSQASFTRAFRRAANMTPGEFRRHRR